MPRLQRLGLTGQQLDDDCDGCLRRPLSESSVRRFQYSTDPQIRKASVPDL